MSSLATADSDVRTIDFSSRMLKAAANVKDTIKQKDDATANSRRRNGNSTIKDKTSENYNLSSVLSQIQDNGPAFDEEAQQNDAEQNDLLYNKNKSNKAEIDEVTSSESDNTKTLDSDYSEEDTLYLSSNEFTRIKQLKLFSGPKLFFIIFFVIIVAFILYKIDLHVKSSIQQTLQNINANYSALNHKHDESLGKRIINTGNMIASDEQQVTSIANNVDLLTNEIRALRTELETVKNNIKTSKKDNSLPTNYISNKAASDNKGKTINKIPKITKAKVITNDVVVSKQKISKKTLSKESVAGTNFIVNMASFSNEAQAKKLAKTLSAAGLSPLVEEAMVKTKQVFRISVSGFTDYDEAKLFISHAHENYGIKGSWLRKN